MKIDSVITNPAPPSQLVIVQGDGWDAAHKVLFGDKPIPFKVTAQNIETEVTRGSGTVEVTIELEDGNKSNSVSFTFLEGELTIRPSVSCSPLRQTREGEAAAAGDPINQPFIVHERTPSMDLRDAVRLLYWSRDHRALLILPWSGAEHYPAIASRYSILVQGLGIANRPRMEQYYNDISGQG